MAAERLRGRASPKLVLVLYYLGGLTLAELAFVLGMPVGTVKSRLHAARHAVRLLWQQPG